MVCCHIRLRHLILPRVVLNIGAFLFSGRLPARIPEERTFILPISFKVRHTMIYQSQVNGPKPRVYYSRDGKGAADGRVHLGGYSKNVVEAAWRYSAR